MVYIYLDEWLIFVVNVDTYTSPNGSYGNGYSSSTPRINPKTLVGADLPVNQHSPEMKWVKYPADFLGHHSSNLSYSLGE